MTGGTRDAAPAHGSGREKADVNTTLAPSLSAADRCDRCGAQAYIRARLVNGGELLFCAHHGRQHLPLLQAKASEIQDESGRLVGTDGAA